MSFGVHARRRRSAVRVALFLGSCGLVGFGALSGQPDATAQTYVPSSLTAQIEQDAADTVARFGGTYRTYRGHPNDGGGEGYSVDYWGPGGWLDPLPEATGDEIVAWTLGQSEVRPVAWIIWYGWWWRPGVGWEPYTDSLDTHGPGREAHVHVSYQSAYGGEP